MNTMTTRERFQAVMNFRPFDRLPIVEWPRWWDKTIDRWHTEGLPTECDERYNICRHFGLELYVQCWFPSRGPGCPQPERRPDGIVGTMKEYEEILPHLYPWPVVDHKEWEELAARQERGEVVLWFTVDGFFWFPREILGVERHLYSFYDQPALIHRMNADLAEWIRRAVDEVCSICTPDFMTFAEDMSYNHGPMLSKQQFDEFLRPYYDRVIPAIRGHGVIPIVDSDGDITVPAAWFEEAGLGGILPLERQAGVDVAAVRRMHPRMRFIGCFDKMTMDKGEAAMRAEFERLLPTAATGGLVVACDHQTPPSVSYDDYQRYLSLFREYAQEAARLFRGPLES